MNFFTALFLAWRYLKPKRNAVSLITCISIIGVTLGVGVLIIVLAVMTGFTDLMKEKLLETTAHVQVRSKYRRCIRKPKDIIKVIEEHGGKAAPIVNSPALIQKNKSFLPKFIIGIDPTVSAGNINLKDNIKTGEYSLETNEAIISSRIADELMIGVGDTILIHSPVKLSKMVKKGSEGKIKLDDKADKYLPEEYTITAIYSFNKYDFDKNIIFLNLWDAGDLFEYPSGAASSIYIWSKQPFDIEPLVANLSNALPGFRIESWKDIHKQILGVLTLEKNMMLFLLAFIVLVAAFSIANTLITVAIQKTREIGLLKSLGASSFTVLNIFILQGFLVGLIGAVCGNILGILIVTYRINIIEFISKLRGVNVFPAEQYFFSKLPAKIVMEDVIIISLIAIVLCTIGAIIPAWRASRLDPAKALRYE